MDFHQMSCPLSGIGGESADGRVVVRDLTHILLPKVKFLNWISADGAF